MKNYKHILEKYGAAGMYVVLNLQIQASYSKDMKVLLSKERTSKWASEWQPTSKTDYPFPAESLIRNVIKDLIETGLAEKIETKEKIYLRFNDTLVQSSNVVKIKRTKVAETDKCKPESKEKVAEYMINTLKVGKRQAELEADKFWDYWQERGWSRRGKSGIAPIKDWKATVNRWIKSSYKTETNVYC